MAVAPLGSIFAESQPANGYDVARSAPRAIRHVPPRESDRQTGVMDTRPLMWRC